METTAEKLKKINPNWVLNDGTIMIHHPKLPIGGHKALREIKEGLKKKHGIKRYK